jgi:hypothetical protein
MSNKHYVNAETVTAGWIISSGTNSQQAVVSVVKSYISNLESLTHFRYNIHHVRSYNLCTCSNVDEYVRRQIVQQPLDRSSDSNIEGCLISQLIYIYYYTKVS